MFEIRFLIYDQAVLKILRASFWVSAKYSKSKLLRGKLPFKKSMLFVFWTVHDHNRNVIKIIATTITKTGEVYFVAFARMIKKFNGNQKFNKKLHSVLVWHLLEYNNFLSIFGQINC